MTRAIVTLPPARGLAGNISKAVQNLTGGGDRLVFDLPHHFVDLRVIKGEGGAWCGGVGGYVGR